jgi:hypothetical protein
MQITTDRIFGKVVRSLVFNYSDAKMQYLNAFVERKYLLNALYLLSLAVLFEGSARLAFNLQWVTDGLWDYDVGWRQSWLARHKSTGEKVYYKFDISDPTKGWISRPNLRNMLVFDNKILNTNSKGFRGTTDYSYKKQPGVTRILILGDSYTFGDEVSDDETYAHYLQKLLPDAEIMNLGVHGYGHDQMLILLQQEGVKYKPDIIILGFLPLDMERNMFGFRDFAKPMFVLREGELVLKGIPVPTPEDVIRWDWLRPRIFDVFSVLHHKIRMRLGLYEQEKIKTTTALLQEMIRTADSIGAVAVFVYLPSGGLGGEINSEPQLGDGEKYLFSVCSANSTAECFSARPHFADKLSQGAIFRTGAEGHWDPASHQTVAEAIKDYLVQAGHMPEKDKASKAKQ